MLPWNIFMTTPPDSSLVPDSSIIHFVALNHVSGSTNDTFQFDSRPVQAQRYDAASNHFQWMAHTGNAGTAANPLFFNVDSLSILNPGFHSQHIYTSPASPSIRFIRRKPFSDLYYVMGAGKEQLLDLRHYQPAGKHLDFTLHYRIVNAPGSFQRQRSNLNAFSLTGRYQTPNQRYTLDLTFRNYIFRNEENGGIANDSLYLSGEISDRRVIPVNLQQASSVQRLSAWTMQHRFRLLKPDDAKKESLLLPKQLILTSELDQPYRVYKDMNPASGYYREILKDSTLTLDSLHLKKFRHVLTLTNQGDKPLRLRYDAGITYHSGTYFDGMNNLKHQLYEGFAFLVFKPLPYLQWHAHSRIIKSGYQDGDHEYQIRAILHIHKKMSVEAGIREISRHPDLFVQGFYGNHHVWKNDFPAQKTQHAWVGLKQHSLSLKTYYTRIENISYFDLFGNPRYQAEPVQLWYTELTGKNESRHLGISYRLRHQMNDRVSLLRYPDFLGSMSLYFFADLFDHALHLHTGADLTYLSGWKGMTYLPEISHYAIQTTTENGNTLLADVFVHFHLSRAVIFLKYRDLASALTNDGFKLVPHYPMARPGLFFGVKWRFFD